MALTAKKFGSLGGGGKKKKSSKKSVQFNVPPPNDPNVDLGDGPQGATADDRMASIAGSQDAVILGTSETRLAASDGNPSESKRGGRNIEIGPPTTDRLGNPLEQPAQSAAADRFARRPQYEAGQEATTVPDHIRQLLGPVETTKRDKNQGEGAGVDMSGPLPKWMEQQRRGAEAVGVAAAAVRQGPQGPPAPPHQGPVGMPVGSNGGGSGGGLATVNVINHTDATLTLVAVEPRTGQRVDKTLYPKQSDSFDAPMGCLISVINPVTERALFRHKVLEQMTTLAVTDAILLRDGEVGSSGKWWDSRAFCIAAGVVGTAALVGIVLLIFYLIHRAKKQGKAMAGGGGRRGSVRL
jgi:hypothetical protein